MPNDNPNPQDAGLLDTTSAVGQEQNNLTQGQPDPAKDGDGSGLTGAPANGTNALMNEDPTKVDLDQSKVGDFPDDWREKMAKGNDKVLNQLKRFGSPVAVAEALLATRQKLSSGEFKKGLSENPSAEELAAYRADNGIPESADKYDTNLDDGLVIGEQDKPYVESFLQAMHSANAPQGVVKQALQAYAANVRDAAEKQAEADEAYRATGEDALRAEWGNEYRANLNGAANFLNTMPEGFRNAILSGRDAEGNALRMNPDVVRALNSMAMQLNPMSTLVSGSGTNANQSIESEMEEIQKAMKDFNGPYWKGPQNDKGQTKMQERYALILQAQERGRK